MTQPVPPYTPTPKTKGVVPVCVPCWPGGNGQRLGVPSGQSSEQVGEGGGELERAALQQQLAPGGEAAQFSQTASRWKGRGAPWKIP